MSRKRTHARKSRPKVLLWVGAGVLLLVGGCVFHVASAFIGNGTVSISRETTVVTEPLTSHGQVDYVAALNRERAAGVTIDDNAAVLLLRAIEPAELKLPGRDASLSLLGIEAHQPAQDVLISSLAYENWYATHAPEGITPPSEQFFDRIQAASRHLWLPGHFPDVADWLRVNETPLAGIAAASERPNCFLPIVRSDPDAPLLATYTLMEQATREAVLMLAVRANLRTAEGRPDLAWVDLFAIHRLARLIGSGPFLRSVLLGYSHEQLAAKGSARLCSHPGFTAEQARRCLADWRSLGELPTLERAFDSGERYTMLDNMQLFIRQGGESFLGTVSALEVPSGHIRWNEAFRIVNAHFDRILAAHELPTFAERSAALQEIGGELQTEAASMGSGPPLSLYATSVIGTRAAATREFTRAMLALLSTGIDQADIAATRAMARERLVELQFVLFLHRAEQGEFPADLNELVPEYLETVPTDPFTDRPMVYRRDGDAGYLLYSVGDNQTDDDGATYDSDPRGDDIVL